MELPTVKYNSIGNAIDPIYTFNKSIFLAGPTPRQPNIKSWRPEALEILKELKYKGTVLIPERQDWHPKFRYESQVKWEYEALSRCRCIVFWIPRSFPHMPALTTNVEFGYWLHSDKDICYGRPDDSEKNRYLDWLFQKVTDYKPINNLKQLIKTAMYIVE
jgi:hypothetical protein